MIDIYLILKITATAQIILIIYGVIVYVLMHTSFKKNDQINSDLKTRLLITSPSLIKSLKILLIALPVNFILLIYSLYIYENIEPSLLIINAVLLCINVLILLVTRIRIYRYLSQNQSGQPLKVDSY
jgi:hypothetical protein